MKAVLSLFFMLLFPLATFGQGKCSAYSDKGWRGMNCFHCMHPRAPRGAAPISELLVKSCLKKVILTFVLDGSFGYSQKEITESIDKISNSGQELWLHLYIYNGPAQRRWQSGVFQSFAVMDPYVFQRKILNNKKVRSDFIKVVTERLLPVVEYASAKGVKISVAPGLEDNLSDQGYISALKLIQNNIPRQHKITYVRNHCFRCAAGNGRSLPQKVILEEHDDLLFQQRWDGIINTDGRYFKFSAENSDLPSLFDLTERWLKPAFKQRNAFILWVPHFQDTPAGDLPKPLHLRNFRGPTGDEEAEIIDFLRSY